MEFILVKSESETNHALRIFSSEKLSFKKLHLISLFEERWAQLIALKYSVSEFAINLGTIVTTAFRVSIKVNGICQSD